MSGVLSNEVTMNQKTEFNLLVNRKSWAGVVPALSIVISI